MKRSVLIALVLLSAVAAPVSAQETLPPPEPVAPLGAPKPPLRALREKAELEKQMLEGQQGLKQEKLDFKQKLSETNTGIRTERREFRDEAIGERRAMNTELVTALKSASSSDERRSILKDAQEERAAFRQNLKSEWDAKRLEFKGRRDALKEGAPDMAAQHARGIMQRLIRALERFEEMLMRIDARIGVLETEGADVSGASAAASAAGDALGAATAAVDDAKSAIEEAAASETPKEEMAAVREAVSEAVEAVKAAHAALKEALAALKSIDIPETTEDDDETTE